MSVIVRRAARRLLRARLFSLLSVLIIAIGVGVPAGAYSVMDALVGAIPSARTAHDIVCLTLRDHPAQVSARLTLDETRAASAATTVFDRTAFWNQTSGALATRDFSRLVLIEGVGGDFFQLLGGRAAIGRLPSLDEINRGDDLVVLSDLVWRTYLNANPEVVGSSIMLGGRSRTIVGVAEASFRGMQSRLNVFPIVWAPLGPARQSRGETTARQFGFLAHLRPGASATSAAAVMSDVIGDVERGAADRASTGVPRLWALTTLGEMTQPVRSRTLIIAVLTLPALVLLIGCANIGHFLLARASGRAGETLIQTALGASRRYLLLEQFTEILLLVIGGGLLGGLLAEFLAVRILDRVREPLGMLLPVVSISPASTGGILLAVSVAMVATAFLAGVVPAWFSSRPGALQKVVVGADRTLGWRGHANVIALQVAASTSLLVAALLVGQFIESSAAAHTRSADVGFDLTQMVVANLPTDAQHYDAARARHLAQAIVDRSRELPGVTEATVGTYLPMALPWSEPPQSAIAVRGSNGQEFAQDSRLYALVGSLAQFGLKTIDGRRITEPPAAGTILISEALARHLFGAASAMGQPVYWRHPRVLRDAETVRVATVAGVFAGAGTWSDTDEVVLANVDDTYVPSLSIAVRAEGIHAAVLDRLVTDVVRLEDPSVALAAIGRGDQVTGASRTVLRTISLVCAMIALAGLVLALVGLFGVLSHMAATRSSEMGLRISLGATRADLVRLVAWTGIRLVLEGLSIGLVIAYAARMLATKIVPDAVPPVGWAAITLVIVPVLLLSVLVCYVPARRAASADPRTLLRSL